MHIETDMMRAIRILKKREDFLRVRGTGRKWVSPTIVVEAAPPQKGEGVHAFGITVTKKTSKLAVERNRIKRRLRAVAYEVLSEAKPCDVVLVGRLAALDAPYDKLVKDARWCLKRLGYVKNG